MLLSLHELHEDIAPGLFYTLGLSCGCVCKHPLAGNHRRAQLNFDSLKVHPSYRVIGGPYLMNCPAFVTSSLSLCEGQKSHCRARRKISIAVLRCNASFECIFCRNIVPNLQRAEEIKIQTSVGTRHHSLCCSVASEPPSVAAVSEF